MADPYLPTAEEITELREVTLDAYAAGTVAGDRDWSSEWAKGVFFEPDGGLLDVLNTLAGFRAALNRQRLDTEEDYVAISAKQDRDELVAEGLRARIAEMEAEGERVTALTERWETAIELGTGNPSIVTRSFAAEIRTALKGASDV